MHNVQLKVAGLLFGGWKSLRAEVGIEQCAGAFDLSVTDRWAGSSARWQIHAGDACELLLNDQIILTGFVDTVKPSFDKQSHGIQVSGRDKTMDLIDCAAIFKTGQWKKSSLTKIVTDICTPFGISVVLDAGVDVGAVFDSFNIEEGERAFEAIDRAARMRAVLVTTDGSGKLLLSKPSVKKAGVSLVQGQNVLSASLDISWKERFSKITIKGQGKGNASDYGDKVAHGKAEITDSSITRYRPLIVIAEQHGTSPTLRERAEWERNVRRGRGTRAVVRVPGWADSNGTVWKPNMLVPVVLPYLGLQQDLLIAKCSYSLDESGSFTELQLASPSAFALLINVKGTKLGRKIEGSNGLEVSRKKAKHNAKRDRDGNLINAATGAQDGDDE